MLKLQHDICHRFIASLTVLRLGNVFPFRMFFFHYVIEQALASCYAKNILGKKYDRKNLSIICKKKKTLIDIVNYGVHEEITT